MIEGRKLYIACRTDDNNENGKFGKKCKPPRNNEFCQHNTMIILGNQAMSKKHEKKKTTCGTTNKNILSHVTQHIDIKPVYLK